MSPPLAAALAVVRGWTRAYTAGLPPTLRDARRAEIESDLWEFHEATRRSGYTPSMIAVHMLARLVLGVVQDIAWRAEQVSFPHRIVQDALWAAAVLSIASIWWLASTLQALDPPPNLRSDGINVARLLYPIRPLAAVPPLPPAPRGFVLLTRSAAHRRLPPPPPPPPPKSSSR